MSSSKQASQRSHLTPGYTARAGYRPNKVHQDGSSVGREGISREDHISLPKFSSEVTAGRSQMLPVPLASLRAVTTSLSVSETHGAGRCLLSACSNSEIIPGFNIRGERGTGTRQTPCLLAHQGQKIH